MKKVTPKVVAPPTGTPPRGKIVIKKSGKVMTIISDCEYRKTPTTIERTRTVSVEGRPIRVTSVFGLDVASSPSEKMLSYIGMKLKKDRFDL